MFEDEFTELQADMADICNEYSEEAADKIFIYAANEGIILSQHFYCINNKLFQCNELNDSGLNIEFDVSDYCQEQVIDILNDDVQKIQKVCEKYNQPVPKLLKLVYEPKTNKFNAEIKYENQTTDDISVFDNYDAWFEEEKKLLEMTGVKKSCSQEVRGALENSNIKITGTNTYIDVEIGERIVRIYGEMIVGGFACYKDSIKTWIIPFDEPVTEAEKAMIIQKITEKTKDSHMVITFE